MSDALPLPPRPNLEQYKKLAKDVQRAGNSGEPDTIREWAVGLMQNVARLKDLKLTPEFGKQIEREARRVEQRWQELKKRWERGGRCTLADAQFFVAREHGFTSWPRFAQHVEGLARTSSPVSTFEAAVDAIVGGNAATLKNLLRENPELVRERSTREHRSTLLHYVSANGVEDFRQKTPKNIVEITKLLLDAGAQVNAESEAYGGGSTALGLVATSIHPERAGVQIELLELLLERGSEIEHPGLTGNRHSAVRGCLANGQGEAARFFAARGAPIDLEEAAGVGRLDVVKTFFEEGGVLKAGATKQQLESGFLYACGYGATEVVGFLLEKGVDPNVRNVEGQTGLHWTCYGPHLEVAELLIQHHASVDAKDRLQRTPLDWALRGWAAWSDSTDRERRRELVALLARAGATLDLKQYEGDENWQPIAEKVRSDPRILAALQGRLK